MCKILTVIKLLALLLVSQCLVLSCANGSNKSKSKNTDILEKMKPEQESAFDALNRLQVQSNGHLYSTFSGIYHDCLPPDSSFVISRAELLVALEELSVKYFTRMTSEDRKELVARSVLAQEEYSVEQCFLTSTQMVNGVIKSVPVKSSSSGIWILPEVLGRRDIILEW